MDHIYNKSEIYAMFKQQMDPISKDSEYTFKFPRKQHFSLPPDVIFQILNKPTSPDGLQKLYQTCKYFFTKRAILVFPLNACCKESMIMTNGSSKLFNLNKNLLFWFTCALKIYKISPSLMKSIYRNSSKILNIASSTISYSDFKFLVEDNEKIKEFGFIQSSILYSDGTNVPINVLFQNLPNLERIEYENNEENFFKETLEKLSEVKFVKPLKSFILHMINVSPCFDAELFCLFLNQNLIPITPKSNQMNLKPYATISIRSENKGMIKERLEKQIREISISSRNKVDIIVYEQ